MLNAEAEFRSRKGEVDEYLRHLLGLEQASAISTTLMNTMKSSALLMMYNVVESTMTNVLQDLFDDIESSSTSFEALNDKMKKVVLDQAKKGSSRLIVERMQAPLGFAIACFDKTECFSGNIDSKLIRETLTELGVVSANKHREAVLLKVKDERNSLAHGNSSFSDCGKNYAVLDLLEMHKKTCVAMQR